MKEINLLHDARGKFYDLSAAQKILVLAFLPFLLLGEGVWLAMLFKQGLRETSPKIVSGHRVLAAETTSFANLLPTPISLPEPQADDFLPANQEIFQLAQAPIKLIYQTKLESFEQIFEAKQIQGFFTTSLWGGEILVVLDSQNLDRAVADLAQKIDLDRKLDQIKLKQILRDEFWRRQQGLNPGTEIDFANLVQEFPGTDGQLANKYLEVDLSQQKLYQWENGRLIATHIISTGKYGPTPIGLHKIMNKAKNAWSPPAQAWTPFWMAYAYNPNLQAYLGFHELPYWDGPNGTKIRRSFDTLGVPVTGGCIQLAIGDAEEVFNWSEVGIPVLIHE